MSASGSVLERYALAYIKKSGDNSNVKEFLRLRGVQDATDWDEGNFEKLYKEFVCSNSSSGRNRESDQCNEGSNGQPTTHIHVHNRGLDFWDYLLLQCCIDSLFGGRGHTTVIYGNTTNQSRENKKKDSEDSRKLLALGIVAAVVCVAFHIGICFWYHSSKKAARKEEKIDYLDNKLKMFRNMEFAVSAISLAALIACVFYPVLPGFGLAILGVNFLVCFVGGLAFHMKHEEELENIKEAKGAVRSYNDSNEAPPAYSPYDPNTAPSAPPYGNQNSPSYRFCNASTTGQQFGNCRLP